MGSEPLILTTLPLILTFLSPGPGCTTTDGSEVESSPEPGRPAAASPEPRQQDPHRGASEAGDDHDARLDSRTVKHGFGRPRKPLVLQEQIQPPKS